MKFSSTLDNVKGQEWGLNLNQLYCLAYLIDTAFSMERVIYDNKDFFFISRTKVVSDLPILTDKPDTVYRYYKQLEEKGLLIYKKIDGKDHIFFTDKCKKWNKFSRKQIRNSEMNPSKLGNESENNSEMNPTYNSIIVIDNNINDTTTPKSSSSENKETHFYSGSEIVVVEEFCKIYFNQRNQEGQVPMLFMSTGYKSKDLKEMLNSFYYHVSSEEGNSNKRTYNEWKKYLKNVVTHRERPLDKYMYRNSRQ